MPLPSFARGPARRVRAAAAFDVYDGAWGLSVLTRAGRRGTTVWGPTSDGARATSAPLPLAVVEVDGTVVTELATEDPDAGVWLGPATEVGVEVAVDDHRAPRLVRVKGMPRRGIGRGLTVGRRLALRLHYRDDGPPARDGSHAGSAVLWGDGRRSALPRSVRAPTWDPTAVRTSGPVAHVYGRPGRHRVRLVLRDAAGNARTVRLGIVRVVPRR